MPFTLSLTGASSTLGITYQWYSSPAGVSNFTPISGATATTYPVTGLTASADYYCVVTCTNSSSTAISNTVTVTVNPFVTPSVSIAAAQNPVCTGTSATFTATPANGGSTPVYQWKVNGNNVGTNSANYAYTPLNGDVVVCELTSDAPCATAPVATSNSITLTVGQPPVVTITPSVATTVCQGDSVTFTATGGGTYAWIKDGNDLNGATGSTYYATGTGTYAVRVTTNGCTVTSPAVPVSVTPFTAPTITASGNVMGTAAIYNTYQWYIDGTAINGATGVTYTATQTGTHVYTVCVTGNGCSKCSPGYTLTVGIAHVSVDAIKVYPNPVVDRLLIESPVPVNISLRSVDGKEVLAQDNAHILHIGNLANGVYMLRILDADNHLLKVERIVKTGK
jgi:hypothetical protein